MESNNERITKTHFSHFVLMTLQNRMSWKTLASLFTELAPTLNETREIISILLKELEALQSTLEKKEKLLEKYQKGSDSFEETGTIENAIVNNDSSVETETIEDDIEVLEEVKDKINEEMCFQMEKEQTRLDVNEMSLSENDSTNEDMEQSYKEIDNEWWYTFVRNEINSDPERKTQRLRAKENDERPAMEKSF